MVKCNVKNVTELITHCERSKSAEIMQGSLKWKKSHFCQFTVGFFGDKLPRLNSAPQLSPSRGLVLTLKDSFQLFALPSGYLLFEPSRIRITHIERFHHGEQVQDVYAHIFPCPHS